MIIGVIGLGNISRGHLEEYGERPETRVTAVCDIYAPRLDAGVSSPYLAASSSAESIRSRALLSSAILRSCSRSTLLRRANSSGCSSVLDMALPLPIAPEDGLCWPSPRLAKWPRAQDHRPCR